MLIEDLNVPQKVTQARQTDFQWSVGANSVSKNVEIHDRSADHVAFALFPFRGDVTLYVHPYGAVQRDANAGARVCE
jgi:hypothetical protein